MDYEKALHMAGFGRSNLYTFLFCGCSITAMTVEILSLTFLAPASACEFDTTSSQRSTMQSYSHFAIMFTAHTWGYLTDTKGRRGALLIAMRGAAIVSALSAFSPHWIVLGVLKFLTVAFIGCGYSIAQVLLAECTPASRRTPVVILSTSIFLIAYGITAVLPIAILPLSFSFYIPILSIQFNSWRLLSLFYTLPTVVCALLVSRALESPKWYLSEGKQEEAIALLRQMYEKNTGKIGDNYKVDALEINESGLKTEPKNFFRSVLARTLPAFKKPFSKSTNLLAWILSLCYMSIMLFMMSPFFMVSVFRTALIAGDTRLTMCQMIRAYQNSSNVTISEPVCSVDNATVSVIFSISMILAICNMFMCGLSSYIGRKTLLIAVQVMSSLALISSNFSTIWMVTAGLVIVYFFNILNYGILCSYRIDIYPTYLRGVAVCLLRVMGITQAQFFISLVSRLMTNYCEYMFYVYGGLTCFGAFLTIFLPSEEKIIERKNRKEEEEEEEEKAVEEGNAEGRQKVEKEVKT